ncbi:hypothetical protein TNCV_4707441 [Trichonephila clavipes]|nr:hypothetical protein TNCV_4707441 [Trichonephila clavipes]
MNQSESDDESSKSIRPGSAMSTKSDSSTGWQMSDCMRRRKAIRDLDKLDLEISKHQTALVFNQAKGDWKSAQQLVKKIKMNEDEKERMSQKRKNEKEDSEGFAFPKKTVRPITPTKALEPLQTRNNFETLIPDPDPIIKVTTENIAQQPRAPHPITLNVSKNYREQIKTINETFPDMQIKTAGDYFKLFPNNIDQSRSLSHFLESDKQFQFYTVPIIENKPLKVVIKGLPRVTLPEEL